MPDGLRRIACGQLDTSIERLEGQTDEERGTAVHETRKSLKRLRATVRLARDELGDEVYRRENGAFRAAGRRLAGARDSEVVLETLDALTDAHPDEAPLARFERFKRTLVGQHGAAQRRLQEGAAIADVLSELRAARARSADRSSGKASTPWLPASGGSIGAVVAHTASPARSRAPRTCTSCANARRTSGTRLRSFSPPPRRG